MDIAIPSLKTYLRCLRYLRCSINFKLKNVTSSRWLLLAHRTPASRTRWSDKEERKQEEESTEKMKEMKREGEKSREALFVITVISKSFSERLDWSLLKSSPFTGNPQEEDLSKRNRRARCNEKEEIGEGRTRVREKLDNSYVYTKNERILIAELRGSCSGLPRGANIVKIKGRKSRLHIKFIRMFN